MRHITLKIPLSALGLGWSVEGDDACVARVEVAHEMADAGALAGGIAPFEEADDALAALADRVLQTCELDLQPLQLIFERVPFHLLVVRKATAPECSFLDRLR